MTLSIFSPKNTLLEKKEVLSVSLKGKLGDVCILPKHAPLVSLMKKGSLKYLSSDKKEYQLNLDKGFFSVFSDEVIVLTEGENKS